MKITTNQLKNLIREAIKEGYDWERTWGDDPHFNEPNQSKGKFTKPVAYSAAPSAKSSTASKQSSQYTADTSTKGKNEPFYTAATEGKTANPSSYAAVTGSKDAYESFGGSTTEVHESATKTLLRKLVKEMIEDSWFGRGDTRPMTSQPSYWDDTPEPFSTARERPLDLQAIKHRIGVKQVEGIPMDARELNKLTKDLSPIAKSSLVHWMKGQGLI